MRGIRAEVDETMRGEEVKDGLGVVVDFPLVGPMDGQVVDDLV